MVNMMNTAKKTKKKTDFPASGKIFNVRKKRRGWYGRLLRDFTVISYSIQ